MIFLLLLLLLLLLPLLYIGPSSFAQWCYMLRSLMEWIVYLFVFFVFLCRRQPLMMMLNSMRNKKNVRHTKPICKMVACKYNTHTHMHTYNVCPYTYINICTHVHTCTLTQPMPPTSYYAYIHHPVPIHNQSTPICSQYFAHQYDVCTLPMR